jgi:hypothetical protein
MKYTTHKKVLKTIDDLKKIEVISGNLTDRYVPIFTSELIEELGFKYLKGYQLGKTKHVVDVESPNGIIRIYNSYDGTLAFRSYIVDDIQIPLTDDRVIHMGERAREFKDIKHIKDIILNSIPNAKMIETKLNIPVDLDSEIVAKIKETIFSDKMRYYTKRGKTPEFVCYVDDVVKKLQENGKEVTLKTYIKMCIDNYIEGNYGIKFGDNIKPGKKVRSSFQKIKFVDKISKLINTEYIEYLV